MMDAGTLDFATFMNTMKSNDNGFGGGNSWIWIIFLLFFLGGFGGFGFNGRDRGQTPTEQQLSNDFLYSNLSSQIRGVNDGVIQGLSGLNTGMMGGFNNISNAIAGANATTGERINGLEKGLSNLGYDLGSQLSDCCCNTQKSIQQFGYENQLGILNQTNAINQSMSALGDKIDAQTALMLKEFGNIKSREDARQINDLTAQLNDAKTANLMATQTANITSQLNAISGAIPQRPIPAYLAHNCYEYPWYYYGCPHQDGRVPSTGK